MPSWRSEGNEPDYRFSLANERTFLAWIRTALAVLAGSVILEQFATHISPRWALVLIAVALCSASGLLCVLAYYRWRDNELAMRNSAPLPHNYGIALLAIFAVLAAAILACLLPFAG
ncbi:DUF202 domain-containing protein [Caenimonas sp. S4]|nr:DUF202 domain-containing protein [Caenimonas soli]